MSKKWDKAVRANLLDAMIAIGKLPGPGPDDVPADQLKKLDRFTALQLGHSMGIMLACTYLKRRAMEGT